MKHKIGKNHFKTQRYSVYYHDKIVSVCIVCKYRFRLNTLSPTPLVLLYFCLSLPRGQSGAYRSNVDPFITILLSGRSNEWGVEKMGFGWYHWVSRWVAMSGRLNGGLQGCQSGKGFSRWPPLTEGNRLAQVSILEVALNVKWAAGDEAAGPWGSLSWDEIQQQRTLRKSQSNTRLLHAIPGDQTWYVTAVHAWLKSTQTRTTRVWLNFSVCAPRAKSRAPLNDTKETSSSTDNTAFPSQLQEGRWPIDKCYCATITNTTQTRASVSQAVPYGKTSTDSQVSTDTEQSNKPFGQFHQPVRNHTWANLPTILRTTA